MYYNRKKQLIKSGCLIAFILLVAIFATHHIYYKFKEERNVDYSSESLDIVFHEKAGDKVSITKATPVTDSVGLSSRAYTLTITNNLTEPVEYQLNLVEDRKEIENDHCEEYQLSKNFIRIAVKEDDKEAKIYTLSDIENNVLDVGSIKALNEKNYSIRLWVSSESGLPNGSQLHYHGILQVVEDNTDLALAVR